MKRINSVLVSMLLIVLMLIIFFCLYYHLKYISAAKWYKAHISTVNQLMDDSTEDDIKLFFKREWCIEKVDQPETGTWRLSFSVLHPEMSEELIISDNPITVSWLYAFIEKDIISDDVSPIVAAILNKGIYHWSFPDRADHSQRNGYIEYELFDENVLCCRKYNPT